MNKKKLNKKLENQTITDIESMALFIMGLAESCTEINGLTRISSFVNCFIDIHPRSKYFYLMVETKICCDKKLAEFERFHLN